MSATYRTRTRPQNFQVPVMLTNSRRVINDLKARYPIDRGPSPLIRLIDDIAHSFERATAHIESVEPPANMRRWRDGVEIALRRDNDRMERHIKCMRRIRAARVRRVVEVG